MGNRYAGPTASSAGFGSDLDLLRKIVVFIQKFLGWILRQEGMFPDQSDRQLLDQEFHRSIRAAFEELLARLDDRSESGLEELTQTLRTGGLTDSPLRMKSALLSRDVRRRDWKRVFQRIDSILGSLRLPGAEAIKEFKEHVEITVERLREHDDDAPQPLFE
jgi:uncharacterized membrane protein YccC